MRPGDVIIRGIIIFYIFAFREIRRRMRLGYKKKIVRKFGGTEIEKKNTAMKLNTTLTQPDLNAYFDKKKKREENNE